MLGPTRARSRVATFFALTWLLGGLWALATPLGGVPDEPGHVIRAASLLRGEVTGSPEVEWKGQRVDVARVPEPFASADPPCFAYPGAPTPACDRGSHGRGDVLAEVENPFATYNPSYYALVGLPTLVHPERASVYVMRFLTAGLVAGLLALALVALLELGAPGWALVGLAVGTTPMALFLSGSVNPNAVEIAAGIALWATLHVWFTHPLPARERSRAARAAVAAIALVSTRAFAPFFLAVIVTGALVAAGRRPRTLLTRPAKRAALAVAVVTVLAVGWTIAAGTLSTTGNDYPEYENVRRFLYDVGLSLDDYERQMIGVFGWLDTPALEHVYVLWFGVLGLVCLAALVLGRPRHRAVVGGLVVLSVLAPIAFQWPVATELGLIWQGRYLLPVMVGLPLVSGVALAAHAGWNTVMGSRLALALPLAILGVLQAASFWWALHRNVIGLDETWIGFTPLWEPPLGWIPLTLAFVAAISAWTANLAALAGRPGAVRRSGSGRAS